VTRPFAVLLLALLALAAPASAQTFPENKGSPVVDQADILRTMGCHVVQGYIFAHPMFEDEFLNWTSNAERGSRSVA